MKIITRMKSNIFKRHSRVAGYAFTALTLALCLASQVSAQASAGAKQFSSADEAAEAFIAAAESFDAVAFKEILGPNSYDIVHTGEPVADREIATEFAKQARVKKTLIADKRNPRRVILAVGEEDWPMPLPIIKTGTKWSFDAASGRQEMLYRRVGRNEFSAINICRGFVEAQHEYAAEKRDGAPVNQYAQRIISSPGKQDGLAWRNPDGSHGGPVGEDIGKAIEKGYTDKTAPVRGYYFKVLKGQGPAAPLGELDYVVKGYMIGGFALIAFPALYQSTGVKTFMVSQDGVVYEKDLGPNTTELAKSIDRFNPDRTWTPVPDDDQ